MKYLNKFKSYCFKPINYYNLKRNRAIFGSFNITGIIKISNKGILTIGDNFGANSGVHANPIGGDTILRLIVFNANAELTIGRNVGISNSSIVCWNKIQIGNNVIIGGGCKIWDTNFHSLNPTIRTSGNDSDIKTSPIIIKDNAFIGGGSIILKGVEIGENSIIAAGSVVQKSIPANVIAGGNPCKIIKALK